LPDHAPPDLIELDGLEQRPEVALAEALVALALDDLEEDGTDDVASEDLQQHALAFARIAIDQDRAALEGLERFAVAVHPGLDTLVVAVGRILERHAVPAKNIHRPVDVLRR